MKEQRYIQVVKFAEEDAAAVKDVGKADGAELAGNKGRRFRFGEEHDVQSEMGPGTGRMGGDGVKREGGVLCTPARHLKVSVVCARSGGDRDFEWARVRS